MEYRAVVLLLAITSPALAYSPYPRTYGGNTRYEDPTLGEYLGSYTDGEADADVQYAIPDYDASPRYIYATPQRPRMNKDAMAALLSAAIDNYIDYDTYSDGDGIWYDDFATPDLPAAPQPHQQASADATLMQLFFNPRSASSSPIRYSLEDLENLERTAAREDNTENQLHELTRNQKPQVNKKSLMPVLGGRVAVLKKGQKEEMFEIPATSVRRPIFARTISNYPDQPEPQQKPEEEEDSILAHETSSKQTTTQRPDETKKSAAETDTHPTDSKSHSQATENSSESSDNSTRASSGITVPRAAETPYLKDRYDTLRSFLDRERKARQERDQKQRRPPHKRFITEQEALTQELSSLKKTIA